MLQIAYVSFENSETRQNVLNKKVCTRIKFVSFHYLTQPYLQGHVIGGVRMTVNRIKMPKNRQVVSSESTPAESDVATKADTSNVDLACPVVPHLNARTPHAEPVQPAEDKFAAAAENCSKPVDLLGEDAQNASEIIDDIFEDHQSAPYLPDVAATQQGGAECPSLPTERDGGDVQFERLSTVPQDSVHLAKDPDCLKTTKVSSTKDDEYVSPSRCAVDAVTSKSDETVISGTHLIKILVYGKTG